MKTTIYCCIYNCFFSFITIFQKLLTATDKLTGELLTMLYKLTGELLTATDKLIGELLTMLYKLTGELLTMLYKGKQVCSIGLNI